MTVLAQRKSNNVISFARATGFGRPKLGTAREATIVVERTHDIFARNEANGAPRGLPSCRDVFSRTLLHDNDSSKRTASGVSSVLEGHPSPRGVGCRGCPVRRFCVHVSLSFEYGRGCTLAMVSIVPGIESLAHDLLTPCLEFWFITSLSPRRFSCRQCE